MSKGLEALERLTDDVLDKRHYYKQFSSSEPYILRDKEIIENELKEKAKFDTFMKRYNIDSVEELDTFFNEHLNNDIDKCSKCKELKALEIIKENSVGIVWKTECSKENIDFVKEVLL